MNDEQRTTILQLAQQFKEFYHFLKKPPLDKQYQKTNLSRLPWYVVIGPKNSGKTTLIAKSELPFILGKKFKHNTIPNSKDCDFWVTAKAVIIDYPGKYFYHCSHIWKLFLRLIKKYSPHHAPQGIVVVLDVNDLSRSKKNKAIRQQIKDKLAILANSFHQHTPVFMVVNQCDRLTGFREFFGDLSRDERWQIWGLPLQDKNSLTKNISKEFNKLNNRIHEQLIWRIQHENKADKRLLIHFFPSRFVTLKTHLHILIKNILADNNKRLSIEGIFFTAASLQPATTQTSNHQTYSGGQYLINIAQPDERAFFVHDLFDHYILNTLASNDSCSLIRKLKLQHLLSLGLIGVVLLCGTLWIRTLTRQITRSDVLQQISTAHEIMQQYALTATSTLPEKAKYLNTLRQALQHFHPTHNSFLAILNPDKTTQQLHKKVLALYQSSLNNLLLPAIASDLQTTLTNPNASSNALYSALKSALMLQNHQHYQPNYIVNTLQKIWQRNHIPQTVQTQLITHLQYFLKDPTQFNFAMPHSVVLAARAQLLQLSPKQLGYLILQSQQANQARLALNLQANQAAASFFIMQPDASIANMYTKSRFQAIYHHEITQAAEATITGNWVIGQPVTSSQLSAKQLVKQLQQEYATQYINAWQNFLAHIQLTTPTSLEQFQEILAPLSSNHSPLQQLIELVQANIPTQLAQQYPLASLNTTSRSPAFQSLSASFKHLFDYLDPAIHSERPDQAIFALVAKRMRNQSLKNPMEQVMQQSKLYPAPFNRWIYQLGQTAWQLSLYQTEQYIRSQWEHNIVPQYHNQMANRFPFAANADKSVSLANFNYFFAPNGLLDDFITTYLKPFINTSHSPWTLRSLDGTALFLSQTTLQQLQDIYRIQNTYFNPTDQRLMIQFSLQPTSMESNVKSVTVVIGNQKMRFNNADTFQKYDFIWPDNISTNVAKIILTGNDGTTNTITTQGPWSWFKLLQQTGMSDLAQTSQLPLTFDKNGYAAKFTLISHKATNPFDLTFLHQFKFPVQLGD